MASFTSWMLPTKRRWRRIIAGHQEIYHDPGNWQNYTIGKGQIIGTNRSIAAPTLIAWRGRLVSNAEMKALSITEAMQIYKANYWNKIKGDSIVGKDSQAIADILADMKSSAGGNAIKVMQRVLNGLGENLKVDGSFGTTSLDALNRQIKKVGAARIFNAFRNGMIAFYSNTGSSFTNGWIRSLNRDYPPMEDTGTAKKGVFVIAIIAILISAYGLYEFNKVNPIIT